VNDQSLLASLFHRESRSILQYVRESYPWANAKNDAARVAVHRIAEAEAASLAKLARLMLKKHLNLPAHGDFPISFTDGNYVAVSYLIPKLISAQRQLLADLERDLPSISDSDLKNAIAALRDLKRANLSELEALMPVKAA
jgi:hypothetical protein